MVKLFFGVIYMQKNGNSQIEDSNESSKKKYVQNTFFVCKEMF